MACKNCECDKTDAPQKRDPLDVIDSLIRTVETLEKRVAATDTFLTEKYPEVEGSCSYWLNKKNITNEARLCREMLINDLRTQGYTVTEP
jgi:hypothetical protein